MRVCCLLVGFLVLLTGCGGETLKPVEVLRLESVTEASWSKLAGKRIFFGHQSVGENILDGISELVAANPKLGIRAVAVVGSSLPSGPGVFHAKIGRNGDPKSKTEEFAEMLAFAGSTGIDVAFHKYCFADFDGTTDVRGVFEHYKTVMARLRDSSSGPILIHVTVPLTRNRLGPRDLLKKLAGMQPDEYTGNIARNEFNDLLRREYQGKEAFFDLAALESLRPDGRMETFRSQGRTYGALVPEYTDDGGHLNREGRRIIAEQLLAFLAELVERR